MEAPVSTHHLLHLCLHENTKIVDITGDRTLINVPPHRLAYVRGVILPLKLTIGGEIPSVMDDKVESPPQVRPLLEVMAVVISLPCPS